MRPKYGDKCRHLVVSGVGEDESKARAGPQDYDSVSVCVLGNSVLDKPGWLAPSDRNTGLREPGRLSVLTRP